MNEKTNVEFIFYANQNVDRIVLDKLVKPIVQDIALRFRSFIRMCSSFISVSEPVQFRLI